MQIARKVTTVDGTAVLFSPFCDPTLRPIDLHPKTKMSSVSRAIESYKSKSNSVDISPRNKLLNDENHVKDIREHAIQRKWNSIKNQLDEPCWKSATGSEVSSRQVDFLFALRRCCCSSQGVEGEFPVRVRCQVSDFFFFYSIASDSACLAAPLMVNPTDSGRQGIFAVGSFRPFSLFETRPNTPNPIQTLFNGILITILFINLRSLRS